MKVSILMTVYNDGTRLLNESISNLLNQTYENFELIIVNDGSTDCSDEIIRKFLDKDKRIIYVERKKNLGRVYSLNEGIEYCESDLIFINDADDISNFNRIEKCLYFYSKYIKEKDKFGLLGTGFKLNNLKSNTIRNYNLKNLFMFSHKVPIWRILISMPFPHSSIMYSKKAILKFGGFSSEVSAGIDYFMLLKISTKFHIYGLNDILMERIIDGDNFFMQKKINILENKNNQIIFNWQKDNIKYFWFRNIPKRLYFYIKNRR